MVTFGCGGAGKAMPRAACAMICALACGSSDHSSAGAPMPLIEPAGSPSQASGNPSKQSKPANRIVGGRRSTKYFSQPPLLVPSSRIEPSGASAMIQLIATFQIGRLPVCLLNVGTMIARASPWTYFPKFFEAQRISNFLNEHTEAVDGIDDARR